MRATLILIIGMLFSASVFPQSKKAESIIETITKKMQEFESVEVEFTFTYADPGSGDDVSEKGKLLISGDKYILDIEGQKVICDGETIWTFIEDAWEVQINAIEEDEETITPSKILTSYNDQYKARLVKEYKTDGVNYQVIELKPEEGKKWVKLDVIVNADKEEFSEITIQDKNGGEMHYKIDKLSPDVGVTDADFTFNKEDYEDVEVVDMR